MASPKSSRPGMLRVVDVAGLRRDHLRLRRSGEEQELIELVRADVADDAAVALAIEEPRRTRLRVHAMRPEPDGLDDAADRAGVDQLAGLDGRPVLVALAVEDRVDAPGLGLDAAHLGQLLERRHARLVGHEVLAVAHDLDAERRALVRDRRAHDELQWTCRRGSRVRLARACAWGNRFAKAAARSGSFA